MMSCISEPRRLLALISPMHQRMASTILLLPQPFGPTTPQIPSSKDKRVLSTKDLKPTSSISLMRIQKIPQDAIQLYSGPKLPQVSKGSQSKNAICWISGKLWTLHVVSLMFRTVVTIFHDSFDIRAIESDIQGALCRGKSHSRSSAIQILIPLNLG